MSNLTSCTHTATERAAQEVEQLATVLAVPCIAAAPICRRDARPQLHMPASMRILEPESLHGVSYRVQARNKSARDTLAA